MNLLEELGPRRLTFEPVRAEDSVAEYKVYGTDDRACSRGKYVA